MGVVGGAPRDTLRTRLRRENNVFDKQSEIAAAGGGYGCALEGSAPPPSLGGVAPLVTRLHEAMNNDPIRLLQNGPLFAGAPGFPGFPATQAVPTTSATAPLLPPSQPELFRAMAAQAGLQFPVYPGLPVGDIKPDMMPGGHAIGGPIPAIPFFLGGDMGFHPYPIGIDGRRKNATRETTAPLKHWLNEHRKNPYPTKADKYMLARITGMSLTQVSTWFANARRRLKKENKMTWSPRNRTGEDDDDDIDITDRPSSSVSCSSDVQAKNDGSSLDESTTSASDEKNLSTETEATAETPSNPSKTASGSKIWKIAEDEEAPKSELAPSTSAPHSPTPSAAPRPSETSVFPQQPPVSFPFPFGPVPLQWQQQMMALMSRMNPTPMAFAGAGMRPDLLALMAQQQRTPNLFLNSLLVSSTGASTPPPSLSVPPASSTPNESDRQSVSPKSSPQSVENEVVDSAPPHLKDEEDDDTEES
ncbi:hypothetical protein QR680_009695 [Steinernema hermaphroditum]|uniref:Homeobox domain-containing protein n=1 Tax=Steinernema hermaphroditum TaxID=289476 RepID=A0AA39ILB4_9BILA|nr:hypothetical protein QR680_009695 [Steinernema hermaphroditum]